MIDKNNEVEHVGIKIRPEHIKNVQNLMYRHPTLRFVYDPTFWKHGPYFEIGVGGDGVDVSSFSKEINELGWVWKEEEKNETPWWKKLFGDKK